MTISITNRSNPITVGIDSDTLALLDIVLVDSKKGPTSVLNPGDKIRSASGEYRITDDDFASTTNLAARLAEISGAKVRLIEKPAAGHFYLLFSNGETLSEELSYVFDVGGCERQFDDKLLISDKNEFSGASFAKLTLPFSPVENLCPTVNDGVNADCYSTHLDYFSASFLFTNSVDKATTLGRTIKVNFDRDISITANQLGEFFEARQNAMEIYDSAILPSVQRLKSYREAQ